MLTIQSTINIAGQTVPQIIPVVQGDTGRSILFTLADFTIPQGSTATYYVQKPSGEAVYNAATIDGNTVLVELTAQSIIEHGDNYGQVRIENDGEVVTSFDFILLVKPFRGIDATQSTTEMNIFDKAVEQAEEAIDDAKDAALDEINQTTGNFAEAFSASKAYSAGEYVMQSGHLYRFTSNHAAGAWTGSDAEAVTVGEELTDVKDGLTAVESDVTDLKEDYDNIDDRVTTLEEGGSGSGLTEDIKQALLQIAEKVAYVDEHGQDYYDALESALYPPADLVSISCVYTQSSTVYDTDSLDSLKHDLVVTAHMSDSTTPIITTYALSGTLTKGTSVITVSYGGKTTTFEVYAEDGASILYALPNATVFNGTSDYIDTDIQLRKEDISFTIFFHVSENESGDTSNRTILHCMHEASPYDGLSFKYQSSDFHIICGTGSSAITSVPETEISEDGIYVAVTHEQGTSKYDAYYKTATTVWHTQLTYNFVSINETVIIGAYQNTGGVKGRYFKGTIYDLKILAEVADDQSILNYLGVSSAPNLVYELPSTTVLNGTSDYIDTDIQLLKKETGFAVLIDTTLDAISDNTKNNTLLHCMDEGAPGYPGITVNKPSNGIMRLAIGNVSTSFSPDWKFGYRGRIGIVKHLFSNTVDVYYVNTGDSSISHISNATAIKSIDKTLLIGAFRDASDVKGRFIKGTIHDIKIYTGNVPTDTITEWVQGGME